jgi:hypothetical protein
MKLVREYWQNWQAEFATTRLSLSVARRVQLVREVARLVRERGVPWFLGAVSKRVVRGIAAAKSKSFRQRHDE